MSAEDGGGSRARSHSLILDGAGDVPPKELQTSQQGCSLRDERPIESRTERQLVMTYFAKFSPARNKISLLKCE